MNRRLLASYLGARWSTSVLPALVVALALLPAAAQADTMDVTLQRLRIPAVDGTDCPVGTPLGTPRMYCADPEPWTRIMAQLGFASAPPVLSPARTLGERGFYVGLEGWITGIDNTTGGDSNYWRLGTEGDEGSGREGRNRFPADVLLWNRIELRKGFPFGFELGTSIGHLAGSSLWALGLEIKWALFEGYRTGVGILPDLAVRGAVETITGNPQFNLTIPTVDVVLSKPLVIARAATITPYLGAQIAWIFADSELIDLTPTIDAGDPMHIEDLNNDVVFPQRRMARYRGVAGVQARYQTFTLIGSFVFDLVKPSDADPDAPADLPRQWQVDASLGFQF